MPEIHLPEITVIPNWTHFIVQICATLILFFVIRHFAWGPMKGFLKKRQDIVTEELNHAEKIKEEAMTLKTDFESQIQEAKEEARKIVENSKNQAKVAHDQIIVAAQEEAQQKINKALVTIEQERKMTYAQLKEDIINITVSSTEKLIKKEIDGNVHNNLFDDFVAEVGGNNE